MLLSAVSIFVACVESNVFMYVIPDNDFFNALFEGLLEEKTSFIFSMMTNVHVVAVSNTLF